MILKLLDLEEGDLFHGACAVCVGTFPMSKYIIRTIDPPIVYDSFVSVFTTCMVCLAAKHLLRLNRSLFASFDADTPALLLFMAIQSMAIHYLAIFRSGSTNNLEGLARLDWFFYTVFFLSCTIFFSGYQHKVFSVVDLGRVFARIKAENAIKGILLSIFSVFFIILIHY